MRWSLLLLLLSGCFPHLRPVDPVVSAPADWLGADAPSGRVYDGVQRATDLPVIPVRSFGLDFEEEMLFELGRGDWGMVEIARVRDRQGQPQWFALVSARDGRQVAVVGDPEAERLALSFPVAMHPGALRVVRLASDTHLEYDVAFYLPDGQLLQAHLTAPIQGRPPAQRNGNAMNHGADRLWGVIDLEESNWAQAQVFLDGINVPVRRLVGVLPLAQRLQQVNGGLAWGGVTMHRGMGGAVLSWALDGAAEPIPFVAQGHGDELRLVGRDLIVDHVARFRAVDGGWDGPVELVGIEVWHGATSALDLRFNPALPDLRYPLDREYRSRMVAGVNGQAGYAVGDVRVWADGDRVRVDVVPRAPVWACERAMKNVLEIRPEAWRLRAQIAPELAAAGEGREACAEYAEAVEP